MQSPFGSADLLQNELLAGTAEFDPICRIVRTLANTDLDARADETIVAEFATLRQRVTTLSLTLSNHIELELKSLQDSTRHAQQVSAWQTAALVPGTLILVLFFTLLLS